MVVPLRLRQGPAVLTKAGRYRSGVRASAVIADGREMNMVNLRELKEKSRIIHQVPTSDSVFGSLDDVVKSYLVWLSVRFRNHATAFDKRLAADSEAARAEAAVFSMLRSQ